MEEKPECTKCELYKDSCASYNGKTIYKSCISGTGSNKAELVLIGEAPGANEIIEGKPFVGKAGRILDECLQKVKLTREDLYITNTIRCRPFMNATPTISQIESCKDYLDKELLDIKPRIIGLLGSVACQRILGRGDITKIQGLTIKSEKYNALCVPLYHPAYILRNPNKKDDLLRSFLTIKQLLVNKGVPKTKFTEYVLCDTIDKFKEFLTWISKVNCFSFDLETTGFDYLSDKILCMAFSWEKGKSIVLPFYKDKQEIWKKKEKLAIFKCLNKLFQSKRIKAAQNIKFDWHFLKSVGISITQPYVDILLMDYLLDENKTGKRSLEEQAALVNMSTYDFEFKTYLQENKIECFENIPTELLWQHNASDSDCTLRLYNIQKPKIKKENLELVLYRIMLPLTEVLMEMEHTGVNVDLDYIKELKIVLENKLKKIDEELQLDPNVIKYLDDKYKKNYTEIVTKYKSSKTIRNKYSEYEYVQNNLKREVFNFKSPVQLKELLFGYMGLRSIKETDKGSQSTDSFVLESLQYESVFCKKLLEYRKIDKLCSTYVANIDEVLGSDKKIHTNYNQTLTVTGRLSSSGPNLQNIPKGEEGKEIRNYFIPQKDHIFLEADFKQLEFRCFAAVSKDPKMIYDIKSGKDIHSIMAARVYKVPLEQVTIEQRSIAKGVVFALLYGGSYRSMAQRLGILEEDAKLIAHTFLKEYKLAARWMWQIQDFAKSNGYIINNFGRKRRLLDVKSPNIYKKNHANRQAINSPIQSMASDITSIVTIRVYNKLKEHNLKSKLIMTIHDSIMLEVLEDELSKVAYIVKSEMEKPIPYVTVPLAVDVSIGKRWGKMHKISFTKNPKGSIIV